jgi:hypothetical protein
MVEGEHPQSQSCPALVAKLVGLEEACHADRAKLVGEHRRTGHLGAKLGGGEAQGKSQRCAAETESERGMSCSETKSQRTK